MAPSKTKKVHKITYTERVLSALNQVQQDHRRHAVHLATLRAQVRKNAESKDDALGPHWSAWVGRAVQKLTNEGIVEHADPGTISLTGLGKKAVSSARQSIGPGAIQDGLVWRQVANISRGTKRPSAFRGADASHGAESISSAKRRKSMASPGRSRVTRQSISLRDASPLTEISELDDAFAEENARLRVKLHDKDAEISNLQRQLGAALQRADERQETDTSRYATPDLAADFIPASPPPGRPVINDAVVRGVIRTQSGSIIPNISKRPTPAPSDSGEEEELTNENLDGYNVHAPDKERQAFPALETAIATLQRDAARTQRQLGEGRQEAAHAETELLHSLSAVTDRAKYLEGCLSDKDALISDLEIKRKDLESALEVEKTQHGEVRSQMEGHVTIISDLQRSVQTLRAETERLRDELRQERDNCLRMSDEARVAQGHDALSEEMLEDSESKVVTLEDMCSKQDAIISDLTTSLSEARQEIQTLCDKVTEAEESSRAFQEDLHEAGRTIGELKVQWNELENRSAHLTSQLQHEQKLNEELSGSVANLRDRLRSADEDLAQARKTAEETEASLERAIAEAGQAAKQRDELGERLETRERELGEAQRELSTSNAFSEKLKDEMGEKNEAVQVLSKKLADAEARVATAEDSLVASETRHAAETQSLKAAISSLEQRMSSTQDEISRLKSQVASAKMERDEARGQAVGLKAETLHVRMEWESEKRHSGALQQDVFNALGRVHEREEELELLQAAKLDDAKTIQALKNYFQAFRQTQMKNLEELDNQINAAQLASTTSMSSGHPDLS